MTSARFVLAVLLALAAGLGLLTRCSRRPRSGPGLLGLAFFTGVLATGLWTLLLVWTGLGANVWTASIGPIGLAALVRGSALREAVWKRPPWPAWILVPAALFLAWGAASTQHLGYDPETMYLLRGKSLAYHGTMWNEDFQDPDRIHLAHRRPLLLPVLYANLHFATGSWDGRMIRLWFALIQVACWAGMYDVLRGKTGRLTSAAALAIWSLVPAHWHSHGGALVPYADSPLSMALLFAFVSEAPLAVVYLLAGAMLKDEGAVFLIPFALFRSWRVALVPLAVGALWQLTARRLPLDMDYLPLGLSKISVSQLPFILRKLASEMVLWKHWSLLWGMILGVLALRAKRLDREDARWLLPLAAQIAAYVVVWTTFEPELLKIYIKVQDMRLLLHLSPLAWTWAVWRWAPDTHLSPATGESRPCASGA